MKHSNLTLRLHFLLLFFLLPKYSFGTDRGTSDATEKLLGESSAARLKLADIMEEYVAIEKARMEAPRSRKYTMRNEFTMMKLGLKVARGSYCENNFAPIEVEILFHEDMLSHTTSWVNWWRGRPEGWFFFKELDNPLCAVFPNRGTQNAKEMSEHDFFHKRKIRVPLKPGRRGTRKNKYEHLRRNPVWKTFLECDCEILAKSVHEDAASICVHGKIVSLSRGVGGDDSFFVHVQNSPDSYKVIAHICFNERRNPV